MRPDGQTSSAAQPAAECEPHQHSAAPRPPALDPAQLGAAARIFRAAGDPARLRILAELRAGERCVSEIAATSAEELSTVSQRLKILHSEGLIQRRRDGKHILYRLSDEHVHALIDTALAHAEEHLAARR
jgi:DNA-binding transcriptional ArsR family regulator